MASPRVTSDTEAAHWKGRSRTFVSEWVKALLKAKSILAFFGLIFAVGIFSQMTWIIIFGTAGLLFWILLYPAIVVFYSQTPRYLSKLNKAKVRGHWDEVLYYVERLKRSHRSTRIGTGQLNLVHNRTLALANLGHLGEALNEFSRFENDPSVPQWLYLGLLAEIYDGGRQSEKALELQLQVVAEKRQTSAVWLDLAFLLVHRLNRPREARKALARAEALEIVDLGKPLPFFLRGIILWRENKPAEAKQELEHALNEFQILVHHELVGGWILFAKAYLCAVEGELGYRSRAKELLAETQQFLIAHREEELLQACRTRLRANH